MRWTSACRRCWPRPWPGWTTYKLVLQDVLKVDLKALIAAEFPGMPVAVCANLPYYITSPIVMKLLGDRLPIESLTVMVQKEAADRLAAVPGHPGFQCHQLCGELTTPPPG